MDSEKRKLPADEDQAPPSPKRRVIGPALPPANPNPTDSNSDAGSNSDDSDDSDDDFGPSLPPPAGQSITPAVSASTHQSNPSTEDQKPETARDQWMLHPPEQSDWASKIDPSQLRNRKFQTGKSARSATGSSKNLDAAWVETPEEKLRRLEDQVMGVGAPSTAATQSSSSKSNAEKDRAMEEKIKKYNERSGKNSRLDKSEHKRKEEEDDPSRRAFDREKDMSVSSKISNAQRREMVSKASDYSTRFSKGSFL